LLYANPETTSKAIESPTHKPVKEIGVGDDVE
jgi:hypothetical protein